MDKRNVDIVLVRMDKIGDLVLSLPVDEHPALLGRRVNWFITKGLNFVTNQAAPQRMSVEFKRRFSPWEFKRMVNWLRLQKPQTIVLLHAPWWVSMAAWWADVPERIGRQSQWHSFLFLNIPVRQKRSHSTQHESDYNFDLVEFGMGRLGVRATQNLNLIKKTFLRLIAPNPFGTVQARGLKPKGYRVVHPGMMGSALNWPQENYVELIKKLTEDLPVVITGTNADKPFLDKVMSLREHPQVRWLVGDLNTSELLDILAQAKAVIAPSTGVIHLAASLGTPSLGIYSPRTVEHPKRWGPKGIQIATMVPPVTEGELFRPEVMNQITVENLILTLRGLENAHVRNHQPAPRI